MSCEGATAEETRDMKEDRNDQVGESSESSTFFIPRQRQTCGKHAAPRDRSVKEALRLGGITASPYRCCCMLS